MFAARLSRALGARFTLLLIATFGLCALLPTFQQAEAISLFSRYKDVTTDQEVLHFPVAELKNGKARYYLFKHGGQEIRFFLLMDAKGVIRAAFDACDVCYLSGKGYDQDKDFMICNNCGMRFHSSRINEVKGGCNPAPLTREFDEKEVRIRIADILTGAPYFPGGAP